MPSMANLPPPFADLTARLLKESDHTMGIIVLVRGPIAGKSHWVYATIPPSRYEDFMHARLNPNGFNLTDYAITILAQGAGENPPLSVQKEMEKEHGIDHDFEKTIESMIEQAQKAFKW